MARQERKGKGKPGAVYLWALVLILIGSAVWGVSAKYAQKREEQLLVQAKMFYFTSDLLTEDGAEYTLNSDTTSVRFTLNNFADALRVSEDPIQYTYTVNGEKSATGQLDSTNKSKTITFSVKAGETYTVSATGIAGYEKTLSATFKVAEAPAGFYKHLDTSDEYYVLLTVWTQDVSGDVTVRFPEGLIPDTTDEKMANVQNYTAGGYTSGVVPESNYGKYSSQTYRFFKVDPALVYTVKNFSVKMGDQEAVSGTP